MGRAFGILAIGLMFLGVATVLAAVTLAIGSGLSHIFAVSTWEATLIVLVAVLGVVWALIMVMRGAAEGLDDLDIDAVETPIIFPEFPARPASPSGKKRKR